MAYAFFRTCTADHTQGGASDSTDFPVSVVFTDTTMKPVGSGGHIQHTVSSNGQTVPADLAFFSDAGLTTLLKFEIESYDATAGTIVAWVKIPTLSHTVDTVFYMAYDDTGVTTFQGDVNGTWNSGFKGVYHLANGTTLSLLDSTGGANALTNHNAVTADAGQVDGSATFVAASSQYLSATAGFSGVTALTASFWTIGPAGAGLATGVISKGTGGFSDFIITRADNIIVGSPVLFYMQNSIGGNTGNVLTTAVVWDLVTPTWHQFALTWDGTTVRTYVDAVADVTASLTGTLNTSDTTLAFGAYSVPTNYFGGTLDEIELSNVARSADWVTATFNNQKASQTFLAVGAETPVSAGSVAAASGSGTATGIGASLFSAVASASGTGTAAAVGASTSAGVASASGTGTALGLSTSTAASVATSAGAATVVGVGASTAASVASAAGAATVLGASLSSDSGVGDASGAATAAAVGLTLRLGVASASGSGTAEAFGAAVSVAVGVASGQGTALGRGASVAAAQGHASGAATVLGSSAFLALLYRRSLQLRAGSRTEPEKL